jgi:hypothetical protein
MPRNLISLLALSLVTSACVDQDDICPTPDCTVDDGAGGKTDETHPTASTGTIKAMLPPVTLAPATVYGHRLGNIIPFRLEPGVAKGVYPGTYCIDTKVGGAQLQSNCTLAVAAKTAVEAQLGAFTFVHGRDELVFGFDVGHVESTIAALRGQSAAIPHAAGMFVYEMYTGHSRQLPISVLPLTLTTVDLSAIPSGRAVRLLPSTGRVLPDALPSHPTYKLCVQTTTTDVDCIDYRPSPKGYLMYQGSGQQYVNLTFAPSSEGVLRESFPVSGTTEIQMKRIDLNHVSVEDIDGTVATVPGKATITATMNAAGIAMNRTMITAQPTGYGVDVPPAVYRVQTTFVHPADGTTITLDETLDLR